MAAQLLKVGQNKVWFNSDRLSDIKEAITKSDLRALIGAKTISVKKQNSQSKVRARRNKLQKSKGNRKGPGSRTGTKTSRLSRKDSWMIKIRVQRGFIRMLKEKKSIENSTYKDLMAKAKGGFFRNKRHIKLFLEERNLFKKNA